MPPSLTRVAVGCAVAALAQFSPWVALALVLGSAYWAPARARHGAILAAGAVVALKQLAAARALPAAIDGALVPVGVALAVLSGVLVSRHALPQRACAVFAALGMVGLGGLAWAWAAPTGLERLARAERVDAVDVLYGGLLARAQGGGCALVLDASCPRDEALLAALVRAAPNRDEAAMALGWQAALAEGWRPQRAHGSAVAVARALETRGRGAEAYRLLSRHPREGEVDGFMALMERIGGADVLWRGGQIEPLVPGVLELAREMPRNEVYTVDFTATGALGESALELRATSFEGPPSVTLRLDRRPPNRLQIDGAARVALGALEAGPHRLTVRFDDDRVGQGGDRNVYVDRLVAR